MDSTDYILYIILSLQIVLSVYLQNAKMEWVVLSSLLITMIVTSGIVFGYIKDAVTPHPFHVQLTPFMELISSVIGKTIYKIPQAIYKKITSKELSPLTFLTSIVALLIPVILMITSTAIIINNKDKNISEESERKIGTYKTVLMANIILVTFGIVCMINRDMIVRVFSPTVLKYTSTPLPYVTVTCLLGSSIWMMYQAVEIMEQYEKDK